MLKCKDVAERASDFLEPDLTWREKLNWHLHLFICGHCRRFVRHFKLTLRVSSVIANKPLSNESAEHLVNKIKHQCDHPDAPH